GGCSMVKLGYDQADLVARWWFDRQLDLDSSQSRWLRQELQGFHAWHRQTQLPAYAELVEVVARQSVGDVTPDQACESIDLAAEHLDTLLKQAVPLFAGLARQLQPAQLQHLKRRFAEEDREWREKWLDGSNEQRIRRRVDDWEERAETYYGRLSREQHDFIVRTVQNSSWQPQLSWERRLNRQQQILLTLEKIQTQKLSQSAAEAEILALIERTMRPSEVRFSSMQQRLQTEACINLAALHQLTTTEQRSRAQKKLMGYERDFKQLLVKR
ncbi:MAG: hypothetical protein EBZ75_14315, partial [Oxalobacteraceae bacterium]|nr:hypothetical protein [Oxalobacteraceae bacterium]